MYTMVRYVFIYMLVPSTNVTVAFSTHAVTPRWGANQGSVSRPRFLQHVGRRIREANH